MNKHLGSDFKFDEHEAIDKLCEQIEQLEEQNKMLIEALKYYTDCGDQVSVYEAVREALEKVK